MRQNMSVPILLGLLLATVPAIAQGPGGGFGGGPGGPGGFGGQRPPFAFGRVSAVDTTAGTITMNGFGGNTTVVKVGTDATIVTMTTITVGDLKVGDQIAVQGVPTGITASQITDGVAPAGLPGPGGPGGFGGGPGGPGGFGGGPGGPAPGFASASGTVKSLPTATDPHLAITLGPGTVLYVKMADNARVSRYTTLTLADIKSGDRIMAMGPTADDGTVTATAVGVNMPRPNFRRGGPGGGGFGGPGGGFGGPPPPGQ